MTRFWEHSKFFGTFSIFFQFNFFLNQIFFLNQNLFQKVFKKRTTPGTSASSMSPAN